MENITATITTPGTSFILKSPAVNKSAFIAHCATKSRSTQLDGMAKQIQL